GDDEKLGRATTPVALIIAPTRELALQIERELGWLYQYTGARIVSCVGGMDSRLERRRLAEGAHIVIGTPGRLRDHIERNGLVTSGLAAVVLDEADEMLDLGFREDLEFILQATPADRRTLLFSATVPKGIAALAKRYQRNALRIEVAGAERGHADIEYRAIRIAPNETEHAVVNLLRFVDAQTALVFCNTRESVRHLHATLLERGFSAVLLSGELSQHERNQSMQAMRDGRARVCVATDVAARGIDLPNLGLVIHAELPHDAEALQHRSGRTGRAGRKGISALLVPASRRHRVERLMMEVGVRAAWSGPPTAEEIRKLDQERLLQDPILMEPPAEEDLALAKLLLAERTPEQLGAALIRVYRSRLPALEDVIDPGNAPERRETRGSKNAYADTAFPKSSSGKSSSGKSTLGKSSSGKGPSAKSAKGPHAGFSGDSAWFQLNIGRTKNADPKWILPMLCRKGKIAKQDIGVIRIFDDETRVEIAESVAAQFAINMRRPGGDNVRVERLSDDSEPMTSEILVKSPKPKHRAKAERKGHAKT
ncbi:MAG TPA: DEAD/DEAH box helicase, partial [Methylovirgula sp.]